MTRDPRVDPRPGDVVTAGYPHHGAVRSVIERDGERLLGETDWNDWMGQRMHVEWECSVEKWRERNADAEIVKVAE